MMHEFAASESAIEARLDDWLSRRVRFFATTSCQTSSGVLLHLLHRFAPGTTVVFLNTGYHFPETLSFRDQLTQQFDLQFVEAASPVSRIEQQAGGRQLFAVDPDRCCQLNKVLPLEPWLAANDVWINGIRAAQSGHRGSLEAFGQADHGCRRWHPLLKWTDAMMQSYRARFDLPTHPLDPDGEQSIGCLPCTRLTVGSTDRAGRWTGLNKTECGLHLPTARS